MAQPEIEVPTKGICAAPPGHFYILDYAFYILRFPRVDPSSVQDQANHADISMTMRYKKKRARNEGILPARPTGQLTVKLFVGQAGRQGGGLGIGWSEGACFAGSMHTKHI